MTKTRVQMGSTAQLSAALAVGLIASCSQSAVRSNESREPSTETARVWNAQQELDWQSRDDAIARELDRTGNPAWAGTYYSGDGLGTNVTIRVAPDAGVTYTWTGCLGTYDLNYGSIREVKSDRLIVDFVINTERSCLVYGDGVPRRFLSSELCFFDWGDRHYMIPATQMFTFCNMVNDGSVVYGTFPLRVDSNAEKRPVRWLGMEPPQMGRPVVPAEYQAHLLERPITGTIRAVLDTAEVEPYVDKTPRQRVRASIDRGSEHGVQTEMRIWCLEKHCIGRVVEVAATDSIVEFYLPGRGPEAGAPRASDLVSTRL